MEFTLIEAKRRMGITDTAQDADIENAMVATMALVENYCDRKFEKKTDLQEVTLDYERRVSLDRFPVESVTAINLEGFTGQHEIAPMRGIIYLDSPQRGVGTVEYVGGYDPLPDALIVALWSVFDRTFTDVNTAALTSVQGGAQIKQVALTGVASVTFDTMQKNIAQATLDGDVPVQIGTASAILNTYRRVNV